MNEEELKKLWGEELFDIFSEGISDEGWLLEDDWADILEKKYPDHTYYDKPEIKRGIYYQMYNNDFEVSKDGESIRPIV